MGPSSGVAISYERVASSFAVLAADASAQGAQKLLAFCRTVLEEGAQRPATFSSWLAGTLVIEFRQRGTHVTLALIVDDGASFAELFSCDLAFVSFESIERSVVGDDAPMGDIFVMISEGLVSLLAPRESEVDMEVERGSDNPTALGSMPNSDTDDDEADTLVIQGWDDVEVTVVRAPPPDLLAASGMAFGTPSDRSPET